MGSLIIIFQNASATELEIIYRTSPVSSNAFLKSTGSSSRRPPQQHEYARGSRGSEQNLGGTRRCHQQLAFHRSC
jgi:hypothetical protein